MSTTPSQPCTSSSAPSSPLWRYLACSPGLCTPRQVWPSHRPPVSVNARQLSSVFAVQSVACQSCRRCCWTPCCFRVCERRERIHERLSEVSTVKVPRVHCPSEKLHSVHVNDPKKWRMPGNWVFSFLLCHILELETHYKIIRDNGLVNLTDGFFVVFKNADSDKI